MYRTPKMKTIEILGVSIAIEIDDYRLEVDDEADGTYSNKVIILKSKYLSEKEYKRVFSHECIHALCDILGCQMNDMEEEMLANTISYMFMQHFM